MSDGGLGGPDDEDDVVVVETTGLTVSVDWIGLGGGAGTLGGCCDMMETEGRVTMV